MLNYIKAELFRVFHKKGFWIYTIVLSALALITNVVDKLDNEPAVVILISELFETTVRALPFVLFLILPLIFMVSSEENKNQTLKNTIACGTSRNTVAISKFIVSLITCIAWAAIILFVFYGSGSIMFGISGEIKPYIIKLLVSFPLFIGAVSVATFIALIINNSTASAFVSFGVFTFTANIVMLLETLVSKNFTKLYDVLITVQLSGLKNTLTNTIVLRSIISGGVYMVVFLGLTLICFNKKEIK